MLIIGTCGESYTAQFVEYTHIRTRAELKPLQYWAAQTNASSWPTDCVERTLFRALTYPRRSHEIKVAISTEENMFTQGGLARIDQSGCRTIKPKKNSENRNVISTPTQYLSFPLTPSSSSTLPGRLLPAESSTHFIGVSHSILACF